MKKFHLYIFLLFLFSCGGAKERENLKVNSAGNTLYVSRINSSIDYPAYIGYVRVRYEDLRYSDEYENIEKSDDWEVKYIGDKYIIKPLNGIKLFRRLEDMYSGPNLKRLNEAWLPTLEYSVVKFGHYSIPAREEIILKIGNYSYVLYYRKSSLRHVFNGDVEGEEYTANVNVKFVDGLSGVPIAGVIYVNYILDKTLSDKYLDFSRRGIVYDIPDKEENERIIKWYYKSYIFPLSRVVDTETNSSEVDMKFQISDKFSLTITAKTQNRLPVSFKVEGGLESINQSYMIKWPSNPIDVNVSTKEVTEPEVIKIE